jgi:superfamily II DNA or RNA helicase
MQLRPYQDRIVTAMRMHHKGQLIVPTGGGKTLCMITDAMRELDSFPQTTLLLLLHPVFFLQNNSPVSSLSLSPTAV